MACLHLHHQGILKPTCHIMNPDTGEDDITVQDLLDNPKYDLLRVEYHTLLTEEQANSEMSAERKSSESPSY